jgi:uncharacterized protein YkwD
MFSRLLAASLLLGWLVVPSAGYGQVREEEEAEGVETSPRRPVKHEGGPDLSQTADLIVQYTNGFRKEEGHPKVEVNAKLSGTARYFAAYMAKSNRFGHTADGNRPPDRAKAHGYEYCIIAENIAYEYSSAGFTTDGLARQLFEGWKHSPHHRKNMLDPDVTETGGAVAQNEDTGYYYAVQMFGRPKSKAITFKVANEADTTVEYRVGDRPSPCHLATPVLTRAAGLPP